MPPYENRQQDKGQPDQQRPAKGDGPLRRGHFGRCHRQPCAWRGGKIRHGLGRRDLKIIKITVNLCRNPLSVFFWRKRKINHETSRIPIRIKPNLSRSGRIVKAIPPTNRHPLRQFSRFDQHLLCHPIHITAECWAIDRKAIGREL